MILTLRVLGEEKELVRYNFNKVFFSEVGLKVMKCCFLEVN